MLIIENTLFKRKAVFYSSKMVEPIRIQFVKFLIDINEKLFFERRLRKFYKQKFKGSLGLILDVGSNNGQTIDFFLRLEPACKIFGFEPNLSLYHHLQSKYKKRPNVKVFNLGISNNQGSKVFYENLLNYTSTFEELNLESDYLKTKAKILGVTPKGLIKKTYHSQVTTLADFLSVEVTQMVDLLKIDVEGHEYACLLGLFQSNPNPKIRYIQLEFHHQDMYKHKITYNETIDLLRSNNFELDAVIKHGFGNFEELIFRNRTYIL